jgi:hypothetical protein
VRFFSLSARGYTLFIEAGIILSVFVAASVWGTRYWYASLAAGRPPAFYQEYFEPAVMTACGKGFFSQRSETAFHVRRSPSGPHLSTRSFSDRGCT